MKQYPVCLTIAGSDSSGGAGIQADLKTMSAMGVYGMSVITAITAQNTMGVRGVHPIPADMVALQLDAVLSDILPDAVKLGMLHNSACVEAVVAALDRYNPHYVVLDPVMISTSGHRLIEEECIDLIRSELFGRTALITPNINEAALLTNLPVACETDMYRAGEALLEQGCRAVLMKGGHLEGQQTVDLLFRPDTAPIRYAHCHIDTPNTHGTGCTLSSAIASALALGNDLPHSVGMAKEYISKAIEAGASVSVGRGHGPVNHLFAPRPMIAITTR